MANAAQNDLRDKMRFEALFRREMTAYFNKVVNTFILRSRNRLPFDVRNLFDEELAAIFTAHYKRVEKPFSTRIRNVLPREVQSTVEEDRLIAQALNQFNSIRSQIQAKNVNDTTTRNINESLAIAISFNSETDTLEDGKVVQSAKQALVGFELILTAGAILKRKLSERVSAIVVTETQVPAEVSKLTETEVLSGVQPSVLGGSARPTPVKKTWVTVGDSRVRETHLEADGQEVVSNKAFIVGGSRLMVPGDSSLGAPIRETVNCRCAAVFDDKDVVAIRFDKLRDEPFMVRG